MSKLPTLLTVPVLVALISAACSGAKYGRANEIPHRYFLELDRAGLLAAALYDSDGNGSFVRLVELNEDRRPIGDTLTAWVQHFGPGKALSANARTAGLVITCYGELLPDYAQMKHVLPGSTRTLYIYMMRGGILVVAAERIPFYEVLLGAGGSVEGYGHLDH